MKKYSKFITAVVATVLSAIVVALTGDNTILASEWVNVAIAGAGAASVFTAPNVPGAKTTKAALAVIMAMLTLAVSLITGGLNLTELLQIAIAGLGAAGVYGVPNEPALGVIN